MSDKNEGSHAGHSSYPREKLNKDLEELVTKPDDYWDDLYDGQYVEACPS